MSAPEVVVSACSSFGDCDAVAALCGSSFPEEVWSQGLSVQQWAQIEAEDLRNNPSWWRQIGLAREHGGSGRLLGVVVLTLEHEADDSISWSEYSRRVGCGPTLLSWMYDQVLDEALLEHECLIDFIAVSPDARGRGVGAKLMLWAETAGTAILAETEAVAVAVHGVDMTLWVAADNAAACRLYQRSGYAVVRRTNSGACTCMASRVHKWFLGHPVWIKMRKQLPAPEHLAATKPAQQSILLAVAANTCAGATMTCVAGDAPFVEVPLGPSPASAPADQAQPGSPNMPPHLDRIPRPAAGVAGSRRPQRRPETQAAVPPSSCGASLAHKQLGQGQNPQTPKIAAVGSGLQQDVGHGLEGGCHHAGYDGKEGQCLQLAAAPATSTESNGSAPSAAAEPAADEKPTNLYSAALAATMSQPCARLVASASIAAIGITSSGSDSEGEEHASLGALAAKGTHGTVHTAGQCSSAVASGADVFELVSLKSDVAAAPACGMGNHMH